MVVGLCLIGTILGTRAWRRPGHRARRLAALGGLIGLAASAGCAGARSRAAVAEATSCLAAVGVEGEGELLWARCVPEASRVLALAAGPPGVALVVGSRGPEDTFAYHLVRFDKAGNALARRPAEWLEGGLSLGQARMVFEPGGLRLAALRSESGRVQLLLGRSDAAGGLSAEPPLALPLSGLREVALDQKGTLAAVSGDGVGLYRDGRGFVTTLPPGGLDLPSVPSAYPRAVFDDAGGLVVVGVSENEDGERVLTASRWDDHARLSWQVPLATRRGNPAHATLAALPAGLVVIQQGGCPETPQRGLWVRSFRGDGQTNWERCLPDAEGPVALESDPSGGVYWAAVEAPERHDSPKTLPKSKDPRPPKSKEPPKGKGLKGRAPWPPTDEEPGPPQGQEPPPRPSPRLALVGKLDAAGKPRWTVRLRAAGDHRIVPRAMALGPQGLVVAGSLVGGEGTEAGQQTLLVRLAP